MDLHLPLSKHLQWTTFLSTSSTCCTLLYLQIREGVWCEEAPWQGRIWGGLSCEKQGWLSRVRCQDHQTAQQVSCFASKLLACTVSIPVVTIQEIWPGEGDAWSSISCSLGPSKNRSLLHILDREGTSWVEWKRVVGSSEEQRVHVSIWLATFGLWSRSSPSSPPQSLCRPVSLSHHFWSPRWFLTPNHS